MPDHEFSLRQSWRLLHCHPAATWAPTEPGQHDRLAFCWLLHVLVSTLLELHGSLIAAACTAEAPELSLPAICSWVSLLCADAGVTTRTSQLYSSLSFVERHIDLQEASHIHNQNFHQTLVLLDS